MDWQTVLVLALSGTVIYILGVFFTAGIRLWPRWRDEEGRIRNNPLHIVEAIFWPVAWYLWAYLYLGWFILRSLWGILRVIARIPRTFLRTPRWFYQLGQWINNPN